MDWIINHKGELLGAVAALWSLVTIIVGLTPSTQDDSAIRRFAERVALLWPSNSRQKNPFSLPGTVMPRIEEEEETVEIEYNAPTAESQLGAVQVRMEQLTPLADELEPEGE